MTDTKQWFIIHALSGMEKQAALALKERIHTHHKADAFGEILVPSEEVVEIKDGKKKSSERKLFPGYILINMDMSDETWHFVKQTPHIMGFVGDKRNVYIKPTPISKDEVERIFDHIRQGQENPRPKIMFEPGEMVRIIDGPFTEFESVVEDVDYNNNRLEVLVIIFGRSTKVELEFAQVQKI